MERSSACTPSDVTSTPKARSPTSSRCPLLSPISPDACSPWPPSSACRPPDSNVWLASAAPDSGFGPSGSLSFAFEGSSVALAPLSIEIPPPASPGEAPSERDVMFQQLDANFARFVRFSGRGPLRMGGKVGLPLLDIISCLLDSDPSGFILHSALLPLLSPCDLRRMRLVSSRWRHAVSRHSRARWRPHSGRCTTADENAGPRTSCGGRCCSGGRCSAADSAISAAPPAAFLRSGAMRATQVSGTPQRQESARRTTLRERFESASGALLASERLARCPTCSCPARVSPQGRSTHCESPSGCGAVLCRSCGSPQHAATACRRSISPTAEPPPRAVNSSPERKLRRRLLKRLCRDL